MSKIMLEPSLREQLAALREPVEFCNAQGETVGHYLPVPAFQKMLYALAKSQVSDEGIAQLRTQTGGRTLQEILKSLRGQ